MSRVILDPSPLLAVLTGEPERTELLSRMQKLRRPRLSTDSYLECAIVVDGRRDLAPGGGSQSECRTARTPTVRPIAARMTEASPPCHTAGSVSCPLTKARWASTR